MIVTRKQVLCFLGLLPFLLLCFHAGTSFGWEVCRTADKVAFCVRLKGQVDLYQLIPSEKKNIKMEMLEVSIVNNSNGLIRIVPEYFYAVTAEGSVIIVDPPLYESIEMKRKLKAGDVPPRSKAEGYLFFPCIFRSNSDRFL